MQLTIKAHFNKMTKDSKKELCQFYIKGDDEKRQELNILCREIVELNIDGIDPLTAEFVKKSQDSKKTVLDFVIKGGTSTDHSSEFYSIAGSDVELTISESQMSIEEFKSDAVSVEDADEDQSGLEFNVNPDGTAELKPADPMANVTDISSKRPKGKTEKLEAARIKAEFEATMANEGVTFDGEEEIEYNPESEDDLPM